MFSNDLRKVCVPLTEHLPKQIPLTFPFNKLSNLEIEDKHSTHEIGTKALCLPLRHFDLSLIIKSNTISAFLRAQASNISIRNQPSNRSLQSVVRCVSHSHYASKGEWICSGSRQVRSRLGRIFIASAPSFHLWPSKRDIVKSQSTPEWLLKLVLMRRLWNEKWVINVKN